VQKHAPIQLFFIVLLPQVLLLGFVFVCAALCKLKIGIYLDKKWLS
jgi:hypothetical protein